ncbi:hypothetical protein K438DRAFT_1777172 [Mycena galopus ATCC 62051]|nr:hypothetical protein K438DRAFT_1777172 [Mycena galopus ATCC 62051]
MQRTNTSLTVPLATSLRQLDTSLTEATTGSEILPRPINVAPNQGTRNETEAVMGTSRKGGKKRKNTDGYCGGESSGKSARPDARASKKARTAPPVSELDPSADAAQFPEDSSVEDGFDGLFDGLVTVDHDAPQATLAPQVTSGDTGETIEDARMKLLKTIAIHNTMFPPDAPRTTSYYRDNSYIVTTPGSYYRTR